MENMTRKYMSIPNLFKVFGGNDFRIDLIFMLTSNIGKLSRH